MDPGDQAECKWVIKQSQEISKQAYNRWKGDNLGFKAGNSVWLKATNLTMDEPSLKLTSKHHSPFLIKEKLSDLTYHLELLLHWKIHNIFHVNVLSKAKPDMIPKCMNPPPPPIKINGEEYWVIDKYINT